jgi:hypothetical protein
MRYHLERLSPEPLNMRSRVLALVLVSLATIMSPATGASKPPIVPTMQDLAITWWGQYRSEFMLLEIDSAGTGTLVMYAAYSNSHVAYRIRGTRLVKYDIAFELDPVGDATSDLFVRGKAYRNELDLTIGAKSLQWKDTIEMNPLSVVTTAIDALEQCRDRIHGTLAGTSVRCD